MAAMCEEYRVEDGDGDGDGLKWWKIGNEASRWVSGGDVVTLVVVTVGCVTGGHSAWLQCVARSG